MFSLLTSASPRSCFPPSPGQLSSLSPVYSSVMLQPALWPTLLSHTPGYKRSLQSLKYLLGFLLPLSTEENSPSLNISFIKTFSFLFVYLCIYCNNLYVL